MKLTSNDAIGTKTGKTQKRSRDNRRRSDHDETAGNGSTGCGCFGVLLYPVEPIGGLEYSSTVQSVIRANY